MKYKRVVVTRRGGPGVLQVVEEELPEPQFGEDRGKILAAGVSGTDVMLREVKVSGFSTPPMPFSFGADLVGVEMSSLMVCQQSSLGVKVARIFPR